MSRTVQYQRGVGGNVSSSTIDNILKEDYVINNIKDTVNMQTYFLSKLKMRKSTGGKRFVFPVRFEIGEGQGFRAEDETLPDPGYGGHKQASGNCTHQYGRFRITGQALHATNRAAFEQALDSAIKNCRDGYKLTTYRAVWGRQTGVIAKVAAAVTVSAAGDTDEVPVGDPYGLDYGTAITEFAALEMHPYFRVYMKLVFGTFNTAGVFTAKNTGQVTGILDNGRLQVKFDGDTNLAAEDVILRGDTTSLNDNNKSYMGILGGAPAEWRLPHDLPHHEAGLAAQPPVRGPCGRAGRGSDPARLRHGRHHGRRDDGPRPPDLEPPAEEALPGAPVLAEAGSEHGRSHRWPQGDHLQRQAVGPRQALPARAPALPPHGRLVLVLQRRHPVDRRRAARSWTGKRTSTPSRLRIYSFRQHQLA